ncbi:hypothetical protein [Cupriavidus necator]
MGAPACGALASSARRRSAMVVWTMVRSAATARSLRVSCQVASVTLRTIIPPIKAAL